SNSHFSHVPANDNHYTVRNPDNDNRLDFLVASGCPAQLETISCAIAIWFSGQNLLMPVLGWFVDRVGLRWTRMVGGLFSAAGLLLFGLATPTYPNSTFPGLAWLLFPAGIFVALGGLTFFTCDMHIILLFPRWRSFMLGLLSGCADASAIFFSLLKILAIAAACSHLMLLGGMAWISILLAGGMASFVLPRSPMELVSEADSEEQNSKIARERRMDKHNVNDAAMEMQENESLGRRCIARIEEHLTQGVTVGN
ncbi:unnamed protein product, partial [Protopolystoma xenopodis]